MPATAWTAPVGCYCTTIPPVGQPLSIRFSIGAARQRASLEPIRQVRRGGMTSRRTPHSKIRNPKLEIRNKHQGPKFKIRNGTTAATTVLVIRASNFDSEDALTEHFCGPA